MENCSNLKDLDLEEWIDSSSLVVLEYDGIIAEVNKVLAGGNSLYIQDEKSIALLQFDAQGKYIRHIGHIGQGPGEYLSVDDIAVDPLTGHVFVLSLEKMALLQYTDQGKYVDEQKLPVFASAMSILPDGFLLFLNSNANELTGTYDVVHVDRKLKIKNLLIDQPGKPNYVSTAGSMFQGSEGTMTAITMNDTIYGITTDGSSAYASYVLDFSPKSLPTEFRSDFSTFAKHAMDYHVKTWPYFETKDWFLFYHIRDRKYSVGWYHKPSNRLFDSITNFKKGSLADLLRMNNCMVATHTNQFVAYFDPDWVEGKLFTNSSSRLAHDTKRRMASKPALLFFTLKAPPM